MATQISSVTSGATAQSGQDHRSSGNFSTRETPANTQHFVWKVTQDGVENNIIRFDVMDDISTQTDPVVYSQLGNNSRTHIVRDRSFYIADPDGAAGQSFLVTVYAE